MFSCNRWPLLIVFLLAGFFALSAWSFHRAARGASAVTDSDYYSHGLRFDQTQLEQKAAASLGWGTQISLDSRQLRVVLTDRSQQPITAARATMTVIDGIRGETLRLALAESSGGTYSGQLPASLHGEQTAQVDFERDGVRLSKRLLLALP